MYLDILECFMNSVNNDVQIPKAIVWNSVNDKVKISENTDEVNANMDEDSAYMDGDKSLACSKCTYVARNSAWLSWFSACGTSGIQEYS